jgi:flagellar biosynthetic protein FliP
MIRWLANSTIWRTCLLAALLLILLGSVDLVHAAEGLPALTVKGEGGTQTYSLSIQILLLMTTFTLLPAALMMMTAFTRIIIVLAILRQALGLVQTPSSQTLLGLALFLTFFVMAPVLSKINDDALQPYLHDKLSFQDAAVKASEPLRQFMLKQTREGDLGLFAKISGNGDAKTIAEIPFRVLVPAFVTSELKTAFQIGFLLFIPFLIIDLVVASVLMSMGMMMLSPMIISLPFKIMLFVLVDGWNIVMGTLASSFVS